MRLIDFHHDWRYCHLGEEDWKSITLPHDAMLSEERMDDAPGGTNTGFFAGRDYVYEKEFTAPEDAAYLAFEGVYHHAEVILDGKSMPAHPNGYFGFRIPVGAGRHTIQVIAHNAEQPNSRWYSGAGIYRPVRLVCLPTGHILPESILVKTLDYVSRRISVSFTTSEEGQVKVEILDGGAVLSQEESSTGCVELTLPDARLWSPDDPKLYTARLTFGEDMQEVRFGIRTVEVDAKEG
ncbi:MAG: glycoside hydrolase family 2, partial [Blautia sp.]|nr:glycoside hydrolase family 2 [Blautia sp.]